MTAKNVIYLHGFASSPGSKKANYFKAPLEARGAHYVIPDLNQPSFERLTLTAMLQKVAETVRDLTGEIYLVGSSLGGLTALHFYDQYRQAEGSRVAQMVLLAPAFDFVHAHNTQTGGNAWQTAWQVAGSAPFFNYAHGHEVNVHYGLVEDLMRYDSYQVSVEVSTTIYHGRHDASVPYDQSVHFSENRPLVTLQLVDSDHELLDQTERILAEMIALFGL
ncbi:MAG: alpha/beta fold hydrolase [Anaerolineae bacterium]|jgi:hypothetical protein|nr:alpha/beta fold hydrolase [Anaerolineae bacterium]